jgi:hypothetical protein
MRLSRTALLRPTTQLINHPVSEAKTESHDEILIGFVWRFPLLLPGTHEAASRQNACLDLWEMHLHHHSLFSGVCIPYLGDSITRSTDFEKNFALNIALGRGNHELGVFRIACSSTSKISLVFLALRMSKVGALICVERKAETTFE